MSVGAGALSFIGRCATLLRYYATLRDSATLRASLCFSVLRCFVIIIIKNKKKIRTRNPR